MVKFQRKSYNHFNEDVESVASIGQKSGFIFGRKGNLSASNCKDVSTFHTKGSLIRVVKLICSFTCARFLMIIALYNLYIANMRAFDDATDGTYVLKAEERQMRQAYFQYEKQVTEAMNSFDILQRDFDQESANSVREAAIDKKLNFMTKNNDYREQIIEDLQTHIQNSHHSQLEKRFGPGPYYVEVKVFTQGRSRYFTLQTVSSDIMPHAVYVFIDMVDRKMWDNSTIVYTGYSNLELVPNSPDGYSLEGDNSNTKLAFSELSNKFSEERNTIGFTEKGVALNLNGNSRFHSSGDENERSIFARVIIGLSTLSFMKQESIAKNIESTVIESIMIVQISDDRLQQYGVNPL